MSVRQPTHEPRLFDLRTRRRVDVSCDSGHLCEKKEIMSCDAVPHKAIESCEKYKKRDRKYIFVFQMCMTVFLSVDFPIITFTLFHICFFLRKRKIYIYYTRKKEKKKAREESRKRGCAVYDIIVRKIMYVICKMCSRHERDKGMHFSPRRCVRRECGGAICRRNDSSTEREILADYRTSTFHHPAATRR